MKPVISPAQIAAQAYASQPLPNGRGPAVAVGQPVPSAPAVRSSPAFTIELSAASQEAAAAGKSRQPAAAKTATDRSGYRVQDGGLQGAGRREAPMAVARDAQAAASRNAQPGDLIDIRV